MSSLLEMQGKPFLILCEGEREPGSCIRWDFSWGLCQPVGTGIHSGFQKVRDCQQKWSHQEELVGKEHWPPRSAEIRGCVVGYVLGERDVLKFQADCAEEGLSVARWQPFSGHPGITYLIQGRRALLLCGQKKACVFPQKCQWGAPYPTLGVGRPGMEYQLT